MDRLSALSDDILRRILHFAPSKESASTSVLSRRWRSLSRSSGAVNLVVPVAYQSVSYQEAFARAAKAALDAAGAPITRLTLRVEMPTHDHAEIRSFLHRVWTPRASGVDVVGDVLSHPAALRAEVLHLALVDTTSSTTTIRRLRDTESEPRRGAGIYTLVSLPSSGTLRVLDLTRCDLKLSAPALPAAAFPRLETFRLRLCSVSPDHLQAIFDAAPELATVHLEYVFFTTRPVYFRSGYPIYSSMMDGANASAAEPPVAGRRFRALTTLVLAWCGKDPRDRYGKRWAIDIDAPRLRRLVYKGRLRRFSLRSPAPELARVDLHILNNQDTECYQEDKSNMEAASVLFWRFLRNFTNARVLRLKVECYLKEIAAVGHADELLCVFPYAEHLELDGVYLPASKTAAVAIANLLDCCPVVRDLVLKLSTRPPRCPIGRSSGRSSLARQDGLDYNKSIDHFTRRSKKARNAIEVDSSGADRDDDVPDIPAALSGRSFACLESTLRRVSLEFHVDEEQSSSSCLGLQLLKFFAENAMALEELSVDSGNRRLHEHLNLINVSTKTCFEHGSCKFSRIPSSVPVDSTTDHDGTTTGGFTLLPLKRRTRMV
ncbi:unnamed protein product [Urochloa humidicola]